MVIKQYIIVRTPACVSGEPHPVPVLSEREADLSAGRREQARSHDHQGRQSRNR